MDTIPLSAVQHWLYCPRQCALIHNEQVWAENRFTAEGQLLHKKANEGPDEHRAAGSILRHLNVSSETLGLTGICDIVEKRRGDLRSPLQITPVEYKRGKPKSHRADEVQVCAQALCLEEMFQTQIATALIFYGTTRRRTEVPLDDGLRALTRSTIAAVREMNLNTAVGYQFFTAESQRSQRNAEPCMWEDRKFGKTMELHGSPNG